VSLRELHPEEPDFSAIVAALRAANLHTTDLHDGEPRYFMLDDGAAFGGLTVFGATALLRSVVVTENKRRRGSGSLMVRKILEHAKDTGVREAWLLTIDAEPFFSSLGFSKAERANAPAAIAATSQFRDLCPASAVLMRKALA
jgi:N-acetylglutamate synthase-like GNAT family acetyltransferase